MLDAVDEVVNVGWWVGAGLTVALVHFAEFFGVAGIHSIYELVHPIAVRAELGHEACLGRVYDQLPGEMDWWPPPDNPTNSSWLVAQARCRIAQTSLITELRKMSEAALHVQLQGKEYSLHHLLLGILQHNAYHSGQIALLKNALK